MGVALYGLVFNDSSRWPYLDLINERPLREDLCLQQLVLQHRGPLCHLGQPRQVALDVSLLDE